MQPGSKKNEYTKSRQQHWDQLYATNKKPSIFSLYYRNRLKRIFRNKVPSGSKVLELGCGKGNLLAALHPSFGVGIDFSQVAINYARAKYSSHTNLKFILADACDFVLEEHTFDYVIISDLVGDAWDVQTLLSNLHQYINPKSRLIINFFSHLWELPIFFAQRLGLASSQLEQNWLTVEDIKHMLALANFDFLENWTEILIPVEFPYDFVNKVFAKIRPFSLFSLSNFVTARPTVFESRIALPEKKEPTVSIIVAARNEEGNIQAILDQVPMMGSKTELIFVEGGSTDNTLEEIKKRCQNNNGLEVSYYVQQGKGKGDAVRLGFSKAVGDILMILDADLTVSPLDLPKFYKALVEEKGDFINGVRLVYPMEKEAMRFFNLLGNKFFSLGFSWILGQPIKDTLCGTKVLWRSDYNKIVENRSYFGDFDPFGDFDLLFGAIKQNMKIIDLPIRYGERTYGETNISRWAHGWLLLKMLVFAAKRLKFV